MPSLLDRVHQQQHRIGALRAFPGGIHHRAVEPPLGREDAGRVDQDHLRVGIGSFMQRDAEHPRARGLRLGADDRDLLADQRVHQRGFARVGRAENGDYAAFLLFLTALGG